MQIAVINKEPRNSAVRNKIKAFIDIGGVKLYGFGKTKAKAKTGKHLSKHPAYLLDRCFKYHHQYRSYGRHSS